MAEIATFFKSYRKIILPLIFLLALGLFQWQLYPYFLVYILYFIFLAVTKKSRNSIFELCMDVLLIVLLITYLAYILNLILQTGEAEGLLVIYFDLPLFMLAVAYIGMDIVRITDALNLKLYLKVTEFSLIFFLFFFSFSLYEYFKIGYPKIFTWIMILYFVIYFAYMIYTAVTKKSRNNIFEMSMDLFFIIRLVSDAICIIPNKPSSAHEFVILFEAPMLMIAVFYLICDIVRIRKSHKVDA